MLARDARITKVTLVEPDVFKLHNVERHLFTQKDVGEFKATLAERWLKNRRPELDVSTIVADLLDHTRQAELEAAVALADIGVCAADNEAAKFHFDNLMRKHKKPWTLGEVLSGGIGGFVHWFIPGGPCYGCVASHLQRNVEVEKPKAPDYSAPGGPVQETTIPASKAAITTIAGLHSVVTLGLLADPANYNPGFTSLLLTLQQVKDVFNEAFRPHRFRVSRSAECLVCQEPERTIASEDLDAALDQALARLAHE